MREQHRELCVRAGGCGRNNAVHAGMAARLEHHRAAQMIVMLSRIPPLLQDRGTLQFGITLFDDADWLTRSVQVDDLKDDGVPDIGQCFSPDQLLMLQQASTPAASS